MSTTNYIITILASNYVEGKILKDHPVNTKLGVIFSELIPIMFSVGACCSPGVMDLCERSTWWPGARVSWQWW